MSAATDSGLRMRARGFMEGVGRFCFGPVLLHTSTSTHARRLTLSSQSSRRLEEPAHVYLPSNTGPRDVLSPVRQAWAERPCGRRVERNVEAA
jgi:hypothetical protein